MSHPRVLTLCLSLALVLGACSSKEDSSIRSEPGVQAPRLMTADLTVDGAFDEMDSSGPVATAWEDLDWEVVEEGVLVKLKGQDFEQRQARSAFLGKMLQRRTQGLGVFETEARHVADSAVSELQLRGEEVPLLAARRLLQGLKESRDVLKWEFSLVRSEGGKAVQGPLGLIVLAGQAASIAITDQVAYVKDFEVEMSMAALTADPIIDVIEEGVSFRLLSFVDPDGRIEASFQVDVLAFKRPIREFQTNLAEGGEVTIQIPEIEASHPKFEVEVPVGHSTFNMGPVEIPLTNAEGEIERVSVRLVGKVTRRSEAR